MKKLSVLIIIMLFLLTTCSIVTDSSIEGLWHVTHIGMIRVTENEYYYRFDDDENFYRSTNESDLTPTTVDTNDSDVHYGTYSISGKNLSVEFDTGSSGSDFEVNAYINSGGTKMTWYFTLTSIKLEKKD
ncbi:MAG: hypothetical protein MJB14_11360 [Spirochaetes bacterium]|nr:hypothetical protein [Spirochaetota bacterium]